MPSTPGRGEITWCCFKPRPSVAPRRTFSSDRLSVSHSHKRPIATSVHSQPVFHLCRWHKFTYCWQVECVKLCHSQRWPWCSSKSWAHRWGMLFSAPKRKHLSIENKARQSPPDKRGSHPTSPHRQTSWGSTQQVPHMERPYFQCIYRLCPNDWDPATPRRNQSFTSNEEDLHRSHPPSHAWNMRAQCGAEDPQDVSNLPPARLICKRHSLSLPPLEKRFEYHTLVLFIESVQT